MFLSQSIFIFYIIITINPIVFYSIKQVSKLGTIGTFFVWNDLIRIEEIKNPSEKYIEMYHVLFGESYLTYQK